MPVQAFRPERFCGYGMLMAANVFSATTRQVTARYLMLSHSDIRPRANAWKKSDERSTTVFCHRDLRIGNQYKPNTIGKKTKNGNELNIILHHPLSDKPRRWNQRFVSRQIARPPAAPPSHDLRGAHRNIQALLLTTECHQRPTL